MNEDRRGGRAADNGKPGGGRTDKAGRGGQGRAGTHGPRSWCRGSSAIAAGRPSWSLRGCPAPLVGAVVLRAGARALRVTDGRARTVLRLVRGVPAGLMAGRVLRVAGRVLRVAGARPEGAATRSGDAGRRDARSAAEGEERPRQDAAPASDGRAGSAGGRRPRPDGVATRSGGAGRRDGRPAGLMAGRVLRVAGGRARMVLRLVPGVPGGATVAPASLMAGRVLRVAGGRARTVLRLVPGVPGGATAAPAGLMAGRVLRVAGRVPWARGGRGRIAVALPVTGGGFKVLRVPPGAASALRRAAGEGPLRLLAAHRGPR